MNYIIIGLGGTGGKIIKSFKRAVREEFRQDDPELPVRVRYLYVDSSKKDLDSSSKWRTQDDVGEDISLGKASQFAITGNNLAARLEDPIHHPVTHRYIGNPKFWSEIFASMNVSETAGGQIRRLGESLFEPRCSEFVGHVEQQMVYLLEAESKQAGVHFHVCAGLAGGTGSGTFLQIVAQLRHSYPNKQLYPIYLYLLLPEKNSPWAKNNEATNYYANGLAALQELNAYLVADTKPGPNLGGPLYAPIDLTGHEHRLLGLKDRVQGVFIASNVNEADPPRTLSVDTDMPELFAHLIYQRVFLLDTADPMQFRPLLDAISLENLQTPDESKQTDDQVKLRSIRFQTFGTKRIIVPEEEIREHFTATTAIQSLLQMRYNNWEAVEEGTAHPGFKSENRNLSFKTDVAREDVRRSWKLSDDHVTLSEGILDNEIAARGWKRNDQHWLDLATRFKDSAWTFTTANPKGGARDGRLDKLEEEFRQHFEEFYRGVGVEKFYETKTLDVSLPERHVTELRKTIEASLMQQWTDGTQSANDLETLLDDLIEDLENRARSATEQIHKYDEKELTITADIKSNKQAWDQIGWGSTIPKIGPLMFTTKADVFEAQSRHLVDLYTMRTARRAWKFAEILLKRLVAELRDRLKPDLANFRSGLDDLLTFFKFRKETTCQDRAVDLSDNVVKFYDPAETRRFAASLLEDEQDQRSRAGQARRKLRDVADEQRSIAQGRESHFAAVVEHAFKNGQAKAAHENISRTQAEQEHQNRVGAKGRYFGVNIVAKLADKFRDQEHLKQYVTDLVASAQIFNQFRTVEITRAPEAVMTIILPKCDELPDFRDRLAGLFLACQSPGVAVQIVDSSRRANEITIISFKYAFPLRYLDQVWFLKEKYDSRIKHGSYERTMMELYCEDHRPDLPSIFRPPPGESGERMLPLLQIVQALGHFERAISRQTGATERFIELHDSQGLPSPYYFPNELISLLEPPQGTVKVAESEVILQVLRTIKEDQVELLNDAVDLSLKQDKYRLLAEREALKELLRGQLNSVRAWREGDQKDKVYLKFRDSTSAALIRVDQTV